MGREPARCCGGAGPDRQRRHRRGAGPMDERSATALRELGGEPDGACARQLRRGEATDADLVLTMTREHREAVLQYDPRALRRVFTLAEASELLSGIDRSGLTLLPADQRARELAARLDAARAHRTGAPPTTSPTRSGGPCRRTAPWPPGSPRTSGPSPTSCWPRFAAPCSCADPNLSTSEPADPRLTGCERCSCALPAVAWASATTRHDDDETDAHQHDHCGGQPGRHKAGHRRDDDRLHGDHEEHQSDENSLPQRPAGCPVHVRRGIASVRREARLAPRARLVHAAMSSPRWIHTLEAGASPA